MADPIVAKLHEWLKAHEAELLEDYRTVLRFPSIESEALPNAPFGQANRDALDFCLSKAYGWGMKTKDLEGFCGFGEFGSGEKLVCVFGHLDVVPVGPGWKYDPFGAEIDGGYVYSRGAVDDKGPTMAAFYAARAIKECVPDLAARLRVVFGCDEESGFECIHRYTRTEESPTFGVAPDAGWPLIHAEKGIANLVILHKPHSGGMTLLEINGGSRPNIVIDSAKAVVRISPEVRDEIQEKIDERWDRNIDLEWEGQNLIIHSTGKAAHGAWPIGGDSAAMRIFRFLMEIAPLHDAEVFTELLEMCHIGGAGLGIDGRDDVSKDLTCNLGIVETTDAGIRMTFNVRYPVTWKGEDVRNRCVGCLAEKKGTFTLSDFTDSKPLYFPLEHPLVATICEVAKEELGNTEKPGVMGGGTYARAVPNTVAIGTGWAGDGDAHQTNERCAIESLYKMSRVYAHLLYRLCLA